MIFFITLNLFRQKSLHWRKSSLKWTFSNVKLSVIRSAIYLAVVEESLLLIDYKFCRSWHSISLKISKFWLFDNSFPLFCFAQIVILMLSTVLTSRAFTFYAIIATKTNCFSGWKFSIRKVWSFHKSMHFTNASEWNWSFSNS